MANNKFIATYKTVIINKGLHEYNIILEVHTLVLSILYIHGLFISIPSDQSIITINIMAAIHYICTVVRSTKNF